MEEAENAKTPAYDDKAWEKMELLLDKHLPVKRKKRRIIFFLLPLALAGGIAFFIGQQKTATTVPITDQKTATAQPSIDKPSSSAADKLIDKTDNKPGTTIITPANDQTIQTQPLETAGENKSTKQDVTVASLPVAKRSDKQKEKLTYPVNNNNSIAQPALNKKKNKRTLSTNDNNNITSSDKKVPAIVASGDKPTQVDKTPDNNSIANNPVTPIISDNKKADKAVAASDKKKEDSTVTDVVKTDPKKQNSKNPRGGKLSINLSFGPDVSSVGLDNVGKLEFQYGVGASYAISKRFSVRTGFFAAKKVYTADSTSYKTPYPIHKLQKIDANCLVYEIPVTLIYNFAAEKNHNWFIAGGVSSYLMKKETYGYYYKNAWGNQQYYERTYKNENTHLFSVINLSGGYQYHISDRFSLMAEPYIKIPASGIGVGKVKLNSAGLLFTVGYKPFVKRN